MRMTDGDCSALLVVCRRCFITPSLPGKPYAALYKYSTVQVRVRELDYWPPNPARTPHTPHLTRMTMTQIREPNLTQLITAQARWTQHPP